MESANDRGEGREILRGQIAPCRHGGSRNAVPERKTQPVQQCIRVPRNSRDADAIPPLRGHRLRPEPRDNWRSCGHRAAGPGSDPATKPASDSRPAGESWRGSHSGRANRTPAASHHRSSRRPRGHAPLLPDRPVPDSGPAFRGTPADREPPAWDGPARRRTARETGASPNPPPCCAGRRDARIASRADRTAPSRDKSGPMRRVPQSCG